MCLQDPSPDWNTEFEGWALYECSETLVIEVYDVVQVKKNKILDVLVGAARLRMQGNRLPEIDYIMDGDEEEGPASIELRWTPPKKKKKDTPKEGRAGTINVMLQFVPVRPMLTKRAVALTKTWYFESTVLGMVFLSMVALALQSPAEPPSPALYGSLRILEIFVATHMGVELLLEMQPLFAAGKLHTCVTQAWWQLHVFVLLCNWASIMMPAVSVAVESQADLISSVSNAGGMLGNSTLVAGVSDTKKLEKLFSVRPSAFPHLFARVLLVFLNTIARALARSVACCGS